MPLMSGGSLELCVCRDLELCSVCVVCVLRILNSKGWGLIMEPDSSSPASICLTVPTIFPSLASPPYLLSPASQFLIRCISLWLWPSLVVLPPSSSASAALPSRSSVFQGHVRRVEEHVGVVVIVVIAEVGQVRLCVAHRPGVVLSDPSAVTEPWLQSQLEQTHRDWNYCSPFAFVRAVKLKKPRFLTQKQSPRSQRNERFSFTCARGRFINSKQSPNNAKPSENPGSVILIFKVITWK